MNQDAQRPLLGVIFAHRSGFPESAVREDRDVVLAAVESVGAASLVLSTEQSFLGAVSNYEEAVLCAELFRSRREELYGVLVSLPNFGDERAVADTLRLAELDVPVLIQAAQDDIGLMGVEHRRDSYCGKISVCNNLNQYGIPFTLTHNHTLSPRSETFRKELERFLTICRVRRGVRRVRVGSIGARPADFTTVRYSEKVLERTGISVVPIDLSEILGWVEQLADDDPRIKAWIERFVARTDCSEIPSGGLNRLARLATVVETWQRENCLDAMAIQCWTALQEFYGVVPCAFMSLMSDVLLPAACEVDVCGAISLRILGLASGRAAALADWNNNYKDDPDRVVLFHCSNLPTTLMESSRMGVEAGGAAAFGADRAVGALHGRLISGPVTLLRVETDEENCIIRAYLAEGELTDDPLETFGGYGVLHLCGLDELMRYICRNGFAHHVGVTPGHVADPIYEALTGYSGWKVYRPNR